ncbi:MAG: TetM/TetW/TetO/TetS family tetracycline resistance ribosomal protection protein [Clostridiales bacterium]|nr:TetM/TetW/TetO/TetS family tetracycline resistance ribosomal protection protein [Clostridiales bacterium]
MMRLVIGILAHVDAGKTTLSEAVLYLTGAIRKAGRVDNRDSFLDNYEVERARGITVFSKQAEFMLNDRQVTLVDTPGHVDFSAEMERTLRILDCAILVVSGADGVQGHTETLWRLLKIYQIPCIVFVNKMDQPGTDRERLMQELRERLDRNCVDFTEAERALGAERTDGGSGKQKRSDAASGEQKRVERGEAIQEFLEETAACDETLLEHYLETGTITKTEIRRMAAERKIFPCYFGSALKLQGIEELLGGIRDYAPSPQYGETFGAKVYKITHDEQGKRLTHLKVTGGSLKVRDILSGREDEKVSQIRVYSGERYEAVPEAQAGGVYAVLGPMTTYPGQGLGKEKESGAPMLEPVLSYRVILPPGCDPQVMVKNLQQLEEEEPELRVVWEENLREIQIKVMGAVQIEILKGMIHERFGIDVEFGAGHIVYKETIASPAEGVGHFEPLRHYAEVHLWMEPTERGSGLQFAADCSEDILDRNWQRLILTHLEERRHKGTRIGAPITDMKITLITGREHLKHTEGGDFRQATYRAVRQGLREAGCRILEPVTRFRLEIPAENVGRAMTDLEQRHAVCEISESDGALSVLTGRGPVATLWEYQSDVAAYTKGRGSFSCMPDGYEICHNEDEVAEQIAYDADADLANPTGSVFCAHGAGFPVPWDEVKKYMQVESPLGRSSRCREDADIAGVGSAVGSSGGGMSAGYGADDEELERIFVRTYGERKTRLPEQGPREVTYRPGKEQNSSASSRAAMIMESTGAAHGIASHRGQKALSVAGDSADDNVKSPGKPGYLKKHAAAQEEYLLVDGYNIIHAWEELRNLAEVTLDGARHRLMDIMSNYQGYRQMQLILVFDAYKVVGNLGQAVRYHNIHVVYTKEAETADQYIEKLAHEIGRRYRVTVATSDGLEQLIIRGQGCLLLSAKDLREDVERTARQIEEEQGRLPKPGKSSIFAEIDEETAAYLRKLRETTE